MPAQWPGGMVDDRANIMVLSTFNDIPIHVDHLERPILRKKLTKELEFIRKFKWFSVFLSLQFGATTVVAPSIQRHLY